MKLPPVKSSTMEGIPEIAMEKSSDQVSIGAVTLVSSGYARVRVGKSFRNSSKNGTYSYVLRIRALVPCASAGSSKFKSAITLPRHSGCTVNTCS